MNKISWRHHYIPQFYLRGFTNSLGTFKIFDVKEKRFLKEGKEFSPESFFFEIDSNTLIKDGIKTDFLETEHYKVQDQRVAKVFNKIRTAQPNCGFNLDPKDWPTLEYFISCLFWRLPNNFSMIESLCKEYELQDFGFKIVDNEEKEVNGKNLFNRIKKDLSFAKFMKLHLPSITYPQIFDSNSERVIQTFPKGLPSICGDNPVILRNLKSVGLYTDDLIFPLSSIIVYLRGQTFSKDVISLIKIEIDLLTFHQAIKYVSCTDEKYIYELIKLDEKSKHKFEQLKEHIFIKLFS
jgi:hypothetical protein